MSDHHPFDSDQTLDGPLSSAAAESVAGAFGEVPGARIGHYKLLQHLGEGGFGTVFMAEQEKPVSRKVAIKIIKLGMDTRQVVARFEQERQALAMMDHPNIAKVFDAGATETGRPFFVMELVKGDPIVEYCDKNHLSIEDRLELFAQVCTAVQHAHTKGIIHRDIKPSNILVSTQDGKPQAKVIDFGISKATLSKLTEKTLFTEHRQLIGTPEYMSPEQAEGSLDIDTRTDVYSLGVLLYELLTGTTPFSSKELRSAAYAEIQRIIREIDPPKPSTRLSRNTDTIASVAARRQTEPRKLGTLVRGELDWIVMKALEKDRTRRYETANGLSMDIRRYLAGEAVVAAPPSTTYRFKKFLGRHKGPVTAGAALSAALVLGLAGTIWQASVASRQRDLAREETVRAVAAEAETKRRADELQRVADFQGAMLAQIDPAAAGFKLTKDLRDRFETALKKVAIPESERTNQLDVFTSQWGRVNATDAAIALIDSTILKPAIAAIETQFKDQPVVAASLRQVLADRYHDLGLDKQALDLGQQILAERRRILGDEHPDTVNSIASVGVYLSSLGKWAESEPYKRDALEKSRRVLGDDHPDTLTRISSLGSFFLNLNRPGDAEPFVREAFDRRRRVMGNEHPDTLASMDSMGSLLQQQGKLAEAEPWFRDVLAQYRLLFGNDDPRTAGAIYELAGMQWAQRKTDQAAAGFRESFEIRRRLLGDVHPSTLRASMALGTALDQSGKPAEAEALLREVLDKQRQLLGPDSVPAMTTLGNLSTSLLGQKKFAEAEAVARETLERRKRVLGDDYPGTLVAHNVMGLVYVRQNRYDEGEPFWREAVSISRRVQGPAHPDTLLYIQNLAGLLILMKESEEAEKLLREVIEVGTPAIGPENQTILSATHRLGGILIDQQRYADAETLLSAAEPAARKGYTGTSESWLSVFLRVLGSARAGLERFPEAEANLIEAHAIAVKTRGQAHSETRTCVESLVGMYQSWEKSDPGKGHAAAAAEWKSKLDAMSVPAQGTPPAGKK